MLFRSKYNSSGACLWAKSGGGPSNDIAYDLAVRSDGLSYVTGYFNQTANFSGTFVTTNGLNDGFVVMYGALGNVYFASKIGGANYDQGKAIVEDVNQCLYAAGEYSGNVAIGINTITTTPGIWSNYVAKLNIGTVGINEIEIENEALNIFPNPANDEINIELPENFTGNFTAEIFDAAGKISYSENFNYTFPQISISTKHFAPGNYFVRLKDAKHELTAEFIISRDK